MAFRRLGSRSGLAAARCADALCHAKDTGLIFVSNEKSNNIIVLDPEDASGGQGHQDIAAAARHAFQRGPRQALRRLRRRRRDRSHRRGEARGRRQARDRLEPGDLRHRRGQAANLRGERGGVVALRHRHRPEHHRSGGADRRRARGRRHRQGRQARLCDVRGRRSRARDRRGGRARHARRRGRHPAAPVCGNAGRQAALGHDGAVGRGLHHRSRHHSRSLARSSSCRRACERAT